jgi:hypothetical protein
MVQKYVHFAASVSPPLIWRVNHIISVPALNP